jgi:2-polyprenyl-3-methyl-5-hydroxy-6-metoxy-1,4-benzoquinol methylase
MKRKLRNRCYRPSNWTALFCLVCSVTTKQSAAAAFIGNYHSKSLAQPLPFARASTCREAAKGFGGSSSSKSSSQKSKAVLKRIQKKYGGTTSQEIAAGTQRSIEKAMSELPSHLQMATKLYQQLRQWNARLETMSILEQASIPANELEGAKRAQAELERIYQEHVLAYADLHNIFQKITWDASADAKAARALTGTMPTAIATRVEKACDIIIEATGKEGRCLDVGCGFGTLVPNLSKKLQFSQIHGVDLSSEMIRNAVDLYPGCHFEACDFLQYQGPTSGFDGILFCSALHDMPDPFAALRKAAMLLRPGGKLVVVHAQGASHVNKQVQSNPVLVQRGLPTAEELRTVATDLELRLVVEPAKANTPRDIEDGYLAVMEKT